MRKRILLSLCAAMTVLVLGGCSSTGTSGSATTGSTSGSGSAAGDPAPVVSAPTVFGVGSTQASGPLEATLLGFTESNGKESWNKPDEGQVFVLVHFEIANTDSKEHTVSSILCFDAYVDDYKVDQDFGAMMEAGDTVDGTLEGGRKLKGALGFQLPADWQTLEIVFNENPFSDASAVTFTITK